jgi:hypothetical protein
MVMPPAVVMVVMVVVPPVVMVMVVPVMVMVMVMVLCELHVALGRRLGPLLVHGSQNSRGVGNGSQQLAERASVHRPIDFVGRYGGLRRCDRRQRTGRRYHPHYGFIHCLLLP